MKPDEHLAQRALNLVHGDAREVPRDPRREGHDVHRVSDPEPARAVATRPVHSSDLRV